MANKYETIEVLKGNKVLNLKEYLLEQQEKLRQVKKEFSNPNRNGALTDKTESAFFHAKEKQIDEQKIYIQKWLTHMDLTDYFENYEITLVVAQKK